MDALGIANTALRMLSEKAIVSFTADSTAARVCLLNFTPAVDEVTSEFDWSFARARVALVEDTESDNHTDYERSFYLPDDMIKLLSLDTTAYLIEGPRIYTDTTAPVALYVRRLAEEVDGVPRIIPDVILPSFFERAIVARLAYRVNLSLTGMAELNKPLQTDYLLSIRSAKNFDAMQSPGSVPEDDTVRWEDVQ